MQNPVKEDPSNVQLDGEAQNGQTQRRCFASASNNLLHGLRETQSSFEPTSSRHVWHLGISSQAFESLEDACP